jgi:hypothetical protein
MDGPTNVTQLLVSWSRGDQAALDALTPLIQQELHRVAARYMAGERPGHLLQPTALVNEAYLRLVDWKNVHWQNRAHYRSHREVANGRAAGSSGIDRARRDGPRSSAGNRAPRPSSRAAARDGGRLAQRSQPRWRHTCGEAPPCDIGPAVHRMVEVGGGTGRHRGRWQCLVAVALATTR